MENEKFAGDSVAVSRVKTKAPSARIPVATYRLQFHRAFRFADATRLVSYLHALGVSDCYASPYFTASPDSPHGYDVIDHNAVNPEIGSEDDYAAFAQELRRYEMGHLLDIVPNHMGIAKNLNPWWTDVLENGPSSFYASCFDIDWSPMKGDLANKVLLPVLGDQYGRVLENQQLTLHYEDGAFVLHYYDHHFPIAPRPSIAILSHRLGDLQMTLGADNPHFLEFQSIITALTHLPLRTETDRDKVIERSREKEIIKKRLVSLTAACPAVQTFLEENVRFFNGVKGVPHSFDPLDELLTDQAYRLAYWRVAAEEINYRRFFDINELAAIRTEDSRVFAATHHLVLRLFAEGVVSGVRIDHIDGLYDPAGYLRRLQQAAAIAAREGVPRELPSPLLRTNQVVEQLRVEPVPVPAEMPCYSVVEKILEGREPLPEHWLVHGTTGYDFLTMVNGIFVAQENERRMTDVYTRFTRRHENFSDLVYQNKKLIMQVALSSELNVLAYQLDRLSEMDRHSRDFTLNSLTNALREIIACFPVYRTYIDETSVTERDQGVIEAAVARAKRRNPATDASVFNFVRDVLLLRSPDDASAEAREAQRTFVMKFQQCTGPVMAKGVEDTAFYLYNRLVSLNEVGGTPDRFGVSLAAFHEYNQERLRKWPHTLLATSTHDTKRSEDVRARINVLSELPEEWRAALRRWSSQNKKKKPLVEGQPAPDRNEEYLFYQTLLGAWPLTAMTTEDHATFVRRMQDYMNKATKEAKVNTSWINPHQAYDAALQDFVRAVLDDAVFLRDFQDLSIKVSQYGMYNSLAQTLLKFTAPGVPDSYQGTELWDFSLVDPDNRRPVDYELRRRLLRTLQERLCQGKEDLLALARELLTERIDGRIKLYVTHKTLMHRRAHPQLFRAGDYTPLYAHGPQHNHICAFARRLEQEELVVVTPRFLARLLPHPLASPLGPTVWGETRLVLPPGAAGRYDNLFTGESLLALPQDGGFALALREVFANFPVALLKKTADGN